MDICRIHLVGCVLLAIASIAPSQEAKPEPAQPGSVVKQLTADADNVAPLVMSGWVREWCRAASKLPSIAPFKVKVKERELLVDEGLFYSGRYGSPLAYARALDLAASHGLDGLAGRRVLDFGYGSIGQLAMMGAVGADVTGVDVAPLLPVMYAGRDGKTEKGRLKLVNGQFPADAATAAAVGTDFDLVISKNTLKRGYIHPAREARPEMLINLGVDDAAFLKQIHDRLKPGGFFVIYNLCPAKAADDKPYIPWADGESPFTKKQFETAGFEVLAFDVVDNDPARALGKALGWDQQMNLETDLFAWYTIARKK